MLKNFKKLLTSFLCFTLAFFLLGCSLFLKSSDPILPHLTALPEDVPVRSVLQRESRPLAAVDEKLAVQLEEMYEIIAKGFRPDFIGTATQVKQVYDEGIKILNTIILNNYSEFEKVHAIHDYLAYYVKYDVDLYNEYLSGNGAIDGDNASFHLSGAILGKSAVCDGISKAFSFLCAMEGITVIRITGEYLSGTDYIPHAWNKVRVDREWYNVDVTMDNALISTNGSTQNILHHGYFLLSDESFSENLCGRHRVSSDNAAFFPSDKDYAFHAECDALKIGDKTYKMEITNQDDLNDIFTFIKKQRGKLGKIELKLKFENYTNDALESVSAYSDVLEIAYAKVPNKAYMFSPMTGKYPYLRYPNGVFLLLIYK